ncbi:tetratricopeptide repeat protein [Pseudobacteroides cellulosolvens]|uniref:Tetratricopeptide repeat protein n=1 Tax=Pseudobacteroides cellulosolvens ATCC 35603 = DSM 2933 TaxID=398512 RepID=A0A0L6JK72_9FIRM|nr:tetratricopeptide repeat protein [Pseudobacteroides cellulosolvens]KNY26179.1 hypothetical protein Bccel_1441 [Pseudobacteroides cellulosolvens ATCC 35603 = DSM 2933]
MKSFMNQAREIFYKERKKLTFCFSWYNRIYKPKWMTKSMDQRFEDTYRHQRILYRNGRIAIGKIVQANTLLFKAGKDDSPAAMVYSEDPYFEENPDKLKTIASFLYSIKGVKCEDEDLQIFSDIMQDEVVPLFNFKVPEKITFGKSVYFTSFIVVRNHLPNGYIDFEYFPVIIYPEKTEASIILPSKYWIPMPKDIITLRTINKHIDLIYSDPEKYLDMAQKFIEYAIYKSRTAWWSRDAWRRRILHFRYQKSTALINKGNMKEAKELLEELLREINVSEAQRTGNTFYMLILSNIVSILVNVEKFEEAKEKIELIKITSSNLKYQKYIETFSKLLKFKEMELNILHDDLDKGGSYLQELLSVENNHTEKGNLLLYKGIYYYKRNEKDKALECLKQASNILKAPYQLQKVQYYIKMCS